MNSANFLHFMHVLLVRDSIGLLSTPVGVALLESIADLPETTVMHGGRRNR